MNAAACSPILRCRCYSRSFRIHNSQPLHLVGNDHVV
jgi:hypothetical protein